MPELPEVETMACDLRDKVCGLVIDEVEVFDDRVLKDISVRKFKRKMIGQEIVIVKRRGKGIIIGFKEGSYLFVQVKMTGFFEYGDHLRQKEDRKETKVILSLSNGRFLNYNDQRLFGWLYVVDRLDDIPYLNTIGLEPLESDFKVDWLYGQLKKRTSPIKPLLMNQHFIAGIGNIYASEILFSAGVHPKKSAKKLTKAQIEKVHTNTIRILKDSIKHRGTSMRNYRDSSGEKGSYLNRIKIYGKENEKCPVCNHLIKRIVQAQRSTFYCQKCQK